MNHTFLTIIVLLLPAGATTSVRMWVSLSASMHVERASNDYKAVITTYEGKHNHDVSAACNSGQEVAMQTAVLVTTTANSLQDQGVRLIWQLQFW